MAEIDGMCHPETFWPLPNVGRAFGLGGGCRLTALENWAAGGRLR